MNLKTKIASIIVVGLLIFAAIASYFGIGIGSQRDQAYIRQESLGLQRGIQGGGPNRGK